MDGAETALKTPRLSAQSVGGFGKRSAQRQVTVRERCCEGKPARSDSEVDGAQQIAIKRDAKGKRGVAFCARRHSFTVPEGNRRSRAKATSRSSEAQAKDWGGRKFSAPSEGRLHRPEPRSESAAGAKPGKVRPSRLYRDRSGGVQPARSLRPQGRRGRSGGEHSAKRCVRGACADPPDLPLRRRGEACPGLAFSKAGTPVPEGRFPAPSAQLPLILRALARPVGGR